jgi:hypothetical protein
MVFTAGAVRRLIMCSHLQSEQGVLSLHRQPMHVSALMAVLQPQSRSADPSQHLGDAIGVGPHLGFGQSHEPSLSHCWRTEARSDGFDWWPAKTLMLPKDLKKHAKNYAQSLKCPFQLIDGPNSLMSLLDSEGFHSVDSRNGIPSVICGAQKGAVDPQIVPLFILGTSNAARHLVAVWVRDTEVIGYGVARFTFDGSHKVTAQNKAIAATLFDAGPGDRSVMETSDDDGAANFTE